MTTQPNGFVRFGLGLAAMGLLLIAGLAPTLGADQQPRKAGCSVESLRGSYGMYRYGIGAFGGQLAAAGTIFFDGSGNFEVVLNISREGEISLDEEYVGTYTIARNCTGEILLEGDVTDRFVVVDDGAGFYGVSVVDGATLNNVATRIHDQRE